MRRRSAAFLMMSVLLGAYLVVASDRALGWSDGVGGASGAVPEHLRKCAEGFEYCKVKTSGCGGCHGDFDAMKYQREGGSGVNVPVIDRISAEIWVSGDADKWEYEPNQ